MTTPMQIFTGSSQKTIAPGGNHPGTGSDFPIPGEASAWSRVAQESSYRNFAVRFRRNRIEIIRLEDDVPETSSQAISGWTSSSAVDLQDYKILGANLVVRHRSLLNEALRDLEEVKVEAQEEGFPPPSDVALANAKRLLEDMHRIVRRRFEVYPTADGEIAIDAPGGRERSVLLFCASDGGALCLVNMNGNHRRARYSNTNTLPDGFLREALVDLTR